MPFRFADGEAVALTVAAIFDGNAIGGEATWIVGLDTFEEHVADQFDRRVFLTLDPDVTAAESRAALDAALAEWPNAELQDQAQFKEAIAGQIDQMLNLIYGLLALAVVIALIGIANTLALSVHERTRELGLLRAIGMHRRQLRRAIRWESLLIAVLGASLGAVLAVGGGWGIVRALDDAGRHAPDPARRAAGDHPRPGWPRRRARRRRTGPASSEARRAEGDRQRLTSGRDDGTGTEGGDATPLRQSRAQ